MATMIQSSCSLKWNTAYSLGGSEIPEIDFFNLRLSFQPPPQNILQKFNQIPDLNLQSKEAPALKVAPGDRFRKLFEVELLGLLRTCTDSNVILR